MSSSLANMMMALALEVSSRRLMILSNSPGLGSLGIFKDWAIHTPPGTEIDKERGTECIICFFFSYWFAFLYFVVTHIQLLSLDFWLTPSLENCVLKLVVNAPAGACKWCGFTLPAASALWDKYQNKWTVSVTAVATIKNSRKSKKKPKPQDVVLLAKRFWEMPKHHSNKE